jgi:hypothetical protein
MKPDTLRNNFQHYGWESSKAEPARTPNTPIPPITFEKSKTLELNIIACAQAKWLPGNHANSPKQ